MERAVEIQCCLLGYVIRKGCEYTGCSYWLNPNSPVVCKNGHRLALSLYQGHLAMWLCNSFCQSVSLSPPRKWELVLWLALINSCGRRHHVFLPDCTSRGCTILMQWWYILNQNPTKDYEKWRRLCQINFFFPAKITCGWRYWKYSLDIKWISGTFQSPWWAQTVKNLPAMQETWVLSLGQ